MTLLKEKSEEFLPKKVYINRKKILELYKKKLLKFHSVSNDNFIYYLKKSLNLNITLEIIFMIAYITF
jgi:hypothetical protein